MAMVCQGQSKVIGKGDQTLTLKFFVLTTTAPSGMRDIERAPQSVGDEG